jgi:hypothetical protein
MERPCTQHTARDAMIWEDVRARQRIVMSAMTAEQILLAGHGNDATVVLGISQAERVATAEFVSGKKLGQAHPDHNAGRRAMPKRGSSP